MEMTNSENLAKQFFDAFNNHDLEKERQLLHPQFCYTAGDGTRVEGIQATIDLDSLYLNAFPDIRMEIRNTYVAGDVIVTEFLLQGTQKGKFMDIEPTNRQVNFPICNVLEVRDNQIYSVREYFDTLTFLQQLGVQTTPQPVPA